MIPTTKLTAAILMMLPVTALAASDITMNRDPGCGCCGKWAAQVRQQFGRNVRVIDDANRPKFQRRVGVPVALNSCHTAIIDGMAFEGHVPINDMERLLAQRPRGVTGLAVAGMPMGSPGMEVAGQSTQHYDVVAFGPAGQKIFSRR